MTDLPPMIPSAEERERDLWIRFGHRIMPAITHAVSSAVAGCWADDEYVTNCLSDAYRDGQQSRQPEIDALRAALDEAQKEATIAWSVCASIHREYAKKRDPLYSTRQADFLKHETDCRAALARIRAVKRDG